MWYLARLLHAPSQELHALELARPAPPASRSGGFDGGPLAGDALGDSGPALDAAAKAAYRERLADLRSDLSEAEAWNDHGRAERSQTEIDALTRELAAAVGLGGRDRTAASAAERARVSVTRAIRAALARIAEQSPTLGSHFDATIRTGTYCSYHPDPRAPISWQS